MSRLQKFIIDNSIIIAVVGATALALTIPSPGQSLSTLNLTPFLIITVFFCQGTGVKRIKSDQLKDYGKILTIGFITSQLLAPTFAYFCAKSFGWNGDSFVGFMLICSMAPTLVSGTIISEQAGGNRTASLILTIILNLVAVFTVPIILAFTLGAEVDIAIVPLLLKLVCLVLVPAILGHFFRRKKEEFITTNKNFFKYLPIFCLSAVIYISMSKQVETIMQLTLTMLIEYSVGSLIVHASLLYITFYTAIKYKADLASAKSTAICCSQKTIPITIAIWTSEFSNYPLALLPAIVFHMCQIYFDGIIAKRWSRSSS